MFGLAVRGTSVQEVSVRVAEKLLNFDIWLVCITKLNTMYINVTRDTEKQFF